MVNPSIRRGDPRELLATAWNPARMTGPLRARDPFRVIRDLMGSDPFASMVQAASTVFDPDIETKETKDSYVLNIDLPGVREEDMEVSVTVDERLHVVGIEQEQEAREGGTSPVSAR